MSSKNEFVELVKALGARDKDTDLFETIKIVLIAIVAGIIIYVGWRLVESFNSAVVKPVTDVGTTIGQAVNAYNQFMGYTVYRIASLGLTFQSGTHPQGLIPRATFDEWVRALVAGQLSARMLWSYCGAYYSMDEVWQIWQMIGTLDVANYR